MPLAPRPPATRRPTALRLEPLEDRSVPATAIGLNFAGGSSGSFAPPDTEGSIGPNHYVQFINGLFRVFNKSTGAQVSSRSDDSFWNAAGISTSITDLGTSDPRIIYDPLSDRWFASEINIPNLGNTVMVGRSNTNDPTGTWKATSYLAVDSNTFGDYDTLGVDANGVYIGTVDFSSTAEVSCTMTSIPKADLLLSTPTVANRSQFTQSGFAMGDILQGVNNFNPNPAHASVVSADHFSFDVVNRTTITGTGAAGAQLGPTFNIDVQATSFPNQSRQPDGTRQIDALDDRFGGRVWQVGDLIVGVHGITVGTHNAVRLTVLSDSQNTVVAEATISDSTYDYTDPSVAMNAFGDMLIGFTRSGGSGSSNGNLGSYARYAFINPANPTSITVDSTSIQLKNGVVNNYHLFGGSFERWGDYSATDVDPNDPTSFWTTQEFAAGSATWGTQISQVVVSPRVTAVTSTAANGTYGVGDVIPITVKFNSKVTVTGTPQLALNAGTGTVATYDSGSTTDTLTFNYTVGVGQNAADLNYLATNSLTLNGGTIQRATVAVDANLTLPATASAASLGGSKDIVIDTRPRVTGGVSSPLADGTYGVGIVVPITVTFSSPVNVTGTPQLALNTVPGGVASFAGGSGTSVLTFNYTVLAGQMAPDLNYTGTGALTLNGGTIKDSTSGADAILTLPDPAGPGSLGTNKNIVIDATLAHPSNVTSPDANGTYGFAAILTITVDFTKPVVVDTTLGVPTLPLNSGGTATYTGGNGTFTNLTFTDVVAAGENSADLNYTSTTALTVPNPAIITDQTSGQPAVLTLPGPGGAGSLGTNKDLVIDALPGQVSNVSSPNANGTYGFGATITIQVAFTKPVAVDTTGGNPTLALNSGAGRVATYTSGSGNSTLDFTYTVGLNDLSAHLDYTGTGALTVPAGSAITDQASGQPAVLTLPAPAGPGSLGANKNLSVDGLPAKPTNVTSSSANGPYGFGTAISIQVTFTKPVVVDTTGGTPTLALNSGGTAVYTGGNGTFTALTFAYTVGLGDFAPDLDAASAGALALNGATITDDASGTPAPLTLPVGADSHSLATNKNLAIDGRPGRPFDVTSSSPNGVHSAGSVIPITVTFTKPVVVDTTGGTPTLVLNSGGTAVYAGGAGTFTQLTFTYTVAIGDGAADLDAASAGALALNGATITDAASSTPAPLAVPIGAADPHSLAGNKNLVIDTTGPQVVEFRALFGTRWYNLAGASRVDLPWKVTAIQVVFDETVSVGTVRSLSGLSARRLTGLKTTTLTWRLATPLVKGSLSAALVTAGTNALKDSAGNPVNPFTQAFTVLWGDFNGDHVVNALDEAGVRAAQTGPYLPGSAGSNPFADLSGDGIVNLIDVGITRSRKGTSLP